MQAFLESNAKKNFLYISESGYLRESEENASIFDEISDDIYV
jgi:hypothetical protein